MTAGLGDTRMTKPADPHFAPIPALETCARLSLTELLERFPGAVPGGACGSREDLFEYFEGDEFVLALPNCDGPAATRVCERIREALALAGLDGKVPGFTCSFGVAPPRSGASLQELVNEADAALYDAKHAGRDCVVVRD